MLFELCKDRNDAMALRRLCQPMRVKGRLKIDGEFLRISDEHIATHGGKDSKRRRVIP